MRATAALFVVVLAGCSQAAVPSPVAVPSATPTPTPTTVASATPAASASAVLDFPTQSEVALAPGRYSSAPPFDIPFTFELAAEGWESAHLVGEFFDFVQFPSEPTEQPSRWIAFGHPTVIHHKTPTPATDLSAAQAAALFANRPDVEAGPVTQTTFAARPAVRLDLVADSGNAQLFGGPEGNFGLTRQHDARVTIVELDGDLLIVLVLAPPAELEAAWNEAVPILDSISLGT